MPNQKNIKNVEQLVDKLSRAKSVFFTDYLGLNVSEVTELRKKFYEGNVEYLVVKNTLLKIASNKNKIKLDDDLFYGSTAIALSYEEPVLAAKIIKDFTENREVPTVKGAFFEGQYIKADEFDKIASLPSKEESLTKLVIMLKDPVRSFASLLKSPMVSLVNVLNGVKESKN